MSTGAKAQWGMAIPQVFTDGPIDMTLVRGLVSRAEPLGYRSLWVMDTRILESVGQGFASLEPLGLLSYAAALTTRAQLGVSVLVTPLRNPVHLTKGLASLDQVSGGRLVVGVGLGSATQHDAVFGVSPDRRLQRFVEGLRVMKALWAEDSVTFKGDFWQFERLIMDPKPVQRPHPPVWFGARHPDALRRAVHYGEGWMGAGSSSTAHFKQYVQQLRRYLEEAGRDPSTFVISKRVYLAVDRDKERAGRRLQEWFGKVYNNAEMAAKVALWGSVAECTEGLAEVVAGGAQLVVLNPVFDQLEHAELLAREVIPHL